MRLIDADTLRDEVDSTLNWNTNNEYNMYSDVMDMIDDAPTLDVQPAVHAKWVKNDIANSVIAKCTNCGFDCGAISFKYCPDCGAKMNGVDI